MEEEENGEVQLCVSVFFLNCLVMNLPKFMKELMGTFVRYIHMYDPSPTHPIHSLLRVIIGCKNLMYQSGTGGSTSNRFIGSAASDNHLTHVKCLGHKTAKSNKCEVCSS